MSFRKRGRREEFFQSAKMKKKKKERKKIDNGMSDLELRDGPKEGPSQRHGVGTSYYLSMYV